MARRTYYSFEKRQKELKKQKKKEAKAEIKRLKAEAKAANLNLDDYLEQEGLEAPEGLKDEEEDDFSGLGIEPPSAAASGGDETKPAE